MIDTNYIQQMSSQLANYDVQAAAMRAERNKASYTRQLDAVKALDTALKTFRSEIRSMNGVGSSMLVNSATFSHEGYATATVGTNAIAGHYDFFVEQLASRHQLALEGLQDGDVDTTGSLVIDQGANSFSIDLATIDTDGDGINSLAELAEAVNNAADNSGVNATLVRSNGETSLVFASENTGAANAITLSTAGTSGGAFDTAVTNVLELSKALDAQIRLGGEGGKIMTNASNTFDQIVDGVSLTFTKIHQPGEQALGVDIGQDKSATKEKVTAFTTAINTLFKSFDSLTASGGENSKRGALAGDSSIRSIESMLNNIIRTDYGNGTLMEFGIVADRNGKLTIDTARFEKAVAADPAAFEKIFTDKGALLDTIDKSVATYTSSTGVMNSRKDTLNSMLRRVNDQFDRIDKQYENYYNRYLRQYTSMMQTMAAMQETSDLFQTSMMQMGTQK